MEVLVVAAIIIIIAVIGSTVWQASQRKANRAAALQKCKQLGTGLTQYISSHDNMLPKEEPDSGESTWDAAAQPDAEDAWFNAIPRAAGGKGTGDYVKEGNFAGFYGKDSLLSLQGVHYPKTHMRKPHYAIAFNTKLHRKDPKDAAAKDAEPKEKPRLKMGQISNPQRTVALFEQGIKNEKRAITGMKSYDGDDCKAGAKQFVARWNENGMLVFIDGHVEQVKATQILETSSGLRIKWAPADAGSILWCASDKEDPN